MTTPLLASHLDIPSIQRLLQERQIDGWLIHDFRGSNSVLTLLLGKTHTTRRAMLFIPARGKAVIACSLLDRNAFEKLANQQGLEVQLYISWREMHAWMAQVLGACKRVAMEYAPGCTLPVVGIVDAGTIELVRSMGVEVVSSADVLQLTVARWSEEALTLHHNASSEVARIKDDAFAFIKHSLASGNALNEYQLQQRIMQHFRDAGMEADEGPIVAVNEHAGDPHFEVSSTSPSPIRKGDWVLIDLWSRFPGETNIYSDITWVGYCGTDVPARHRQVFEIVRAARDASVACCQQAWHAKRPLQGWELDDAARLTIINAGFERGIRHRTGHSLSPGPRVHGLGFNLDNLETRETRQVLPGLGFTIEPGIYLPDAPDRLGVRLEINMYIDDAKGPIVTSCFQKDIVLCG